SRREGNVLRPSRPSQSAKWRSFPARQGNRETAYGGLMYRMLTLIWAMGVVLFASHAQAVAPMGEYGPARTTMVSESRTSSSAHLANHHKTSVRKAKRTRGKSAHKQRVAHTRKHARSDASRQVRTASRR